MKKTVTLLLFCCVALSSLLAQEAGFLGYNSNHISDEKAKAKNIKNPEGAYVTRIIKGTAAEAIGLQPFDILMGIDGKKVSKGTDFSDLLDETTANQSVQIMIERDGKIIRKKATLGERVHNAYTKKGSFLGVHSSHDAKPKGWNGALIGGITDNSNAEMMTLQDGDLITKVNEFEIFDWHDLGIAMDAIDEGEEITVQFVRNNTEFTSPTLISRTHSNTVHSTDEWNMADMWEMEEPEMADMPATIFEAMDMDPIVLEEEMEEPLSESELADIAEPASINTAPVAPIQNVQIERLTLFPNPNQGLFEISFFLPQSGPTNIRIFDQSGRQVFDRQLNNFEGLFQDQINISNQAAGTYFLFITQGETTLNRKIVVAKP
ncbi:MAG: PDZ domain-containing protein [Bacteroidota bacterium]